MLFCIIKGDCFYGCYWGSIYEIDCLYFDVCYYVFIEWAIEYGVNSFDFGVGG